MISRSLSPDPSTGAVVTPIYANSTFLHESPGVHKGWEYGRTHNPTRQAFERAIADLESGTAGFAFASGLAAIANILVPAGVPAICGEEGICSGCGVATLSISYYDLGVTTGKMAAKILTGEADISTMPIEYTDATPKYNPTICEELGIQPLDGYEAIEG